MIEFHSVGKTYADGTVAVADFSLTVPSHRTVALVGSSGSGKTTLLRMVNRMVDPTSGTVAIDGRDITTVDPVTLRRSIGYVLQAGGLRPHRTVLDNVATVPVLTGTPRRAARQAAWALLDRVGLDSSLADRYPSQLSGGQQQRVGVARALAADPNIVLMDEPFGAVDPVVRRELQDELRRLQRDLGSGLRDTYGVEVAFRTAAARSRSRRCRTATSSSPSSTPPTRPSRRTPSPPCRTPRASSSLPTSSPSPAPTSTTTRPRSSTPSVPR